MEVALGGRGLRGAPMHAANPAVLGEGGPGSPWGGGHRDLAAPLKACLGAVVCPPGACDVTVGCQAVYWGG